MKISILKNKDFTRTMNRLEIGGNENIIQKKIPLEAGF